MEVTWPSPLNLSSTLATWTQLSRPVRSFLRRRMRLRPPGSERNSIDSQLSYRQMAELIPQIVWTVNADSDQVEYFNRRWYEYTGMAPGELKWRHLMHPADLRGCLETWQKSFATGKLYETEYRLKDCSSGEYRWFLARALPMKSEEGKTVRWFGTCTDIHDQKQLTEALRDREERLEIALESAKENEAAVQRALKLRDEFLGFASHELRTPITSMRLHCDFTLKMIQEQGFQKTPQQQIQQTLVVMDRQLRNLTSLVTDLLDVSRIQNGKLILRVARMNLGELIQRVVSDSVLIQGHPHEIHVEAEPDLIGNWDPQRIEQVVVNLVSNAIQYGRNNPIRIRASAVSEDRIELVVRDQGIGIPPDLCDRIFERFVQGPDERHRGGLGLGLFIVKEIISAHRGTIEVESDLGRGSTFRVLLPR